MQIINLKKAAILWDMDHTKGRTREGNQKLECS
jgi:hypothetical protein